MANQFRFFIGKNKEELDKTIPVIDDQMLMTVEPKNIYQDLNGERIKIEFNGDWNENDPSSDSFIKNRTHYIDKDGKIVKLPKKFLPDGSEVYPDIFMDQSSAEQAAARAEDIGNDGAYHVGQLLLVFVNGVPQWFYITEKRTLGVIGSNVSDGDLNNFYIQKSEVVKQWDNVDIEQYDLPISYGTVREVVGEIETVLKTV